MIVCNLCGDSVLDLGSRCTKCYGRAIERPNPVKALLSSPQKRGSPDRWADKYTKSTTHAALTSSPLSNNRAATTEHRATASRPGLSRKETFDVALTAESDAELARVYGSVLEQGIQHPQCMKCGTDIRSGMKIYLARNDAAPLVAGDTLCKPCYTSSFSIGACHDCKRPIIGEREEGLGGRHIGARGLKWHGKCFACSLCGKPPSRQTQPLLLPSAKPACEGCYDVYFSTNGRYSSSKDISPGVVTTTNKYARPGQLLQGSRLPPRPAETAQELKRLMLPGTMQDVNSAAQGTVDLRPCKIMSPTRPQMALPNADRQTEQLLGFNRDLQSPPDMKKVTSVQDRVRQLNAQTTASDAGGHSPSTQSSRQPLYPLTKHNR
uniref:LIM zinc-binding domain-containing protein n=1 Tax=Kwoniella pini CBS 10737 TaxID=1296096 RepID=A0A1B9IA61_9TREE|nr:uncharacterized protein I206_01623 [Kwoniella pini CBS 10737]OCF52334.1 hypothetical protein I206_01623 [Kwoniella pini CBS 10737]